MRVVGGGRMLSSAPGGQTIQIKGGQPFINNVQGVRNVLPTNGKGSLIFLLKIKVISIISLLQLKKRRMLK